MKSWATGPIVRPLRVMTPNGRANGGNLTGKTFTENFLAAKRSTEAGQSANSRPRASSTLISGNEPQMMSALGASRPLAANVATISSRAGEFAHRVVTTSRPVEFCAIAENGHRQPCLSAVGGKWPGSDAADAGCAKIRRRRTTPRQISILSC